MPLVFSATGGMGTSAKMFYKQLASLISEKNNETIQAQWDGLDAALVSPSYVTQSCA